MTSDSDDLEQQLRENLKLRRELGTKVAKAAKASASERVTAGYQGGGDMDQASLAQPQWHMSRGGKQYGPFSAPDLSEMAELGTLLADDLLWKPGYDTWKPASAIPGY